MAGLPSGFWDRSIHTCNHSVFGHPHTPIYTLTHTYTHSHTIVHVYTHTHSHMHMHTLCRLVT